MLADKAEYLDEQIWKRTPSSVKVVAGKARLGLLTVLAFIFRWPDWQMTSLYTRGFRVAGIVEPSNMYPGIDTKTEGTLHDLLDEENADVWNSKLSSDNNVYDHDKAVWFTAKEQLVRELCPGPFIKAQVDSIFGKGKCRGIRRRGILQNDKVRGIDNARTSDTNFAAWLQDTIMTTPHDIAM